MGHEAQGDNHPEEKGIIDPAKPGRRAESA